MGIASAIGSIASSGEQASASESAANTEANAADYAANLAHEAEQQASALYNPYSGIGTTYGNALTAALPYEENTGKPDLQFSAY